MPAQQSDNPFRTQFRDAILDNSSLRGDLNDNEANILLNWSLDMADSLAGIVQDEIEADEKFGSLRRLIKNIAQFTTRRFDYDPIVLEEILTEMDGYSRHLGGVILPIAQRQELLTNHQHLANLEVMARLMRAYQMPTLSIPGEDDTRPMSRSQLMPTDPGFQVDYPETDLDRDKTGDDSPTPNIPHSNV
jgi:hypothetical protein